MPNSDGFCAHVRDLLAPLGAVRTRAMFGGHGVYLDALCFGLIVDEVLYLKADDGNRARFEKEKLGPFVYHSPKGPMAMSYHRAPDAGMDDSELLCEWASTALDAARRAAAKKSPAKKPVAPARKPAARKRAVSR